MSAYRFCRSDDIELLVQAYNSCYRVSFVDLPALTVPEFKRKIRELALWTSSCMVALEGRELIAVLLAAKRDTENCVLALGVHPDHREKEHGRHMLTSLSQKLAILGPPRLLAEVPAEHVAARRLFESCGYRTEVQYTDHVAPSSTEPSPIAELVSRVTFDELEQNDAFDKQARRCWSRAPETLARRAEQLDGFAIASDRRIEASLLYDRDPIDGHREIAALFAHDEARADRLWPLLLRHVRSISDLPVRMSRASAAEVAPEVLASAGFVGAGDTIGYAVDAAE